MKIKNLIKKLSKLNPEAEVILASDAEGNAYSKYCHSFETSYRENDSDFEFFEKLDIKDGHITKKEFDKLKPAIILYPE